MKITHTRRALLATVSILASIGSAHAQSTGSEPGVNNTAPNAASPQAAVGDQPADANSGLGDIVVTATKRETNLQKTPIAISVINDVAIKDRHILSLNDLADGSVPSLRVATFEARNSALTIGIRGIVPFDQNQTARDTPIGVYIDGVYLGRSQGLNAALFDVQRIEVLKGPQGTLFGRNTEGGALSIVTKEPTGEFDGRLVAGAGNFGSHNFEGHLDLPAYYSLAVKLDAVEQHQNPTVRNALQGQAGFNQYERVGGRVSAKWTPVEGFTALVTYDKARDENTPNLSQLINYNPQGKPVGMYQINPLTGKFILTAPGSGPTIATCSPGCIAPLSPLVSPSGANRLQVNQVGVPQQVSVDKTEGTSINLKYKLTPGIEARSISAWRTVSTDQYDNVGGTARTIFAPNTGFSRYSLSFLNQRQFSQELQLVGSIPQIDFVLGGYYFNERVQEQAATPTTNTFNVDGTGFTINSETVVGPITSSNQGYQTGQLFLQRASFAFAKSYAAFGQATFTPAGFDQVHLTLGGRYTKDKRTGSLYLVSGVATPYQLNFSSSRFDPLAILAVDAAPGVNLYAKYSTGFRSGGANDRSATFLAFGPEVVKAYEIGAKMDFLDRRVRLNLAGYIMDRTGTQTDFDSVDTTPTLPSGAPNPTFNLHTENTANAPGTSKIRGVEADLTAKVTDALTVGGSYAYTYTKIPDTPNPNFANSPLTQVFVVYTPRNAASAFADYAMPLSGIGATFRLHLDANYASSQYSFQNEPTRTDNSFVVNGRVAIADIPVGGNGNRVTLSLYSRNLLNTTYIYRRSAANAGILGDYGNFNVPRTFGGEVSVKF